MRKLLTYILILAMVLPLCACAAAYTPTTQSALENLGTTATPAASTPIATTIAPTEPVVTTLPTEPTVSSEPSVTTQPAIIVRPTDPENLISEARKDGLNYIPCFHAGGPNSKLQFWFKLDENCYPGMNITYDLSVSVEFDEYWHFSYGGIYDFTPLENGKVLMLWSFFKKESIQNIVDAGGSMFVEAVIRAEGYIVGYGIFEVGTDGTCCGVMRSETVIFPMVDGQLQGVTEEYVRQKIAECEQTITPFDAEAKQAEEEAYWAAN